MISLSTLYIGLAIFYVVCKIKAISGSELTKEILIVFIVKLLMLTAIYLMFFSNAKKITLTDINVRYFNKFNNDKK